MNETLLNPDLAASTEWPASPAQLLQLSSGSSIDRVRVVEFEGLLDEQRLVRSFAILVARHDALRTFLRMEGEAVTQVVLESRDTPLVQLDFRHLPLEAQQEAIARVRAGESRDAHDLFQGTLLRLEDRRYRCTLEAGSLVLDGFSFELLLEDLAEIYRAQDNPAGMELTEPGLQYADCALWEASMHSALAAPQGAARLLPHDEPLASPASGPSRRVGFAQRVLAPESEGGLRGCDAAAGGESLFHLALAMTRLPQLASDLRSAPVSFTLRASGRTMPDLAHSVGPLQKQTTFHINLDQRSRQNQLPVALQRELSQARTRVSFGAPVATSAPQSAAAAHQTVQPTLVDGCLNLARPFAPDVLARWAALENFADEPATRSELAAPGFTARLLEEQGRLLLGLWSGDLDQAALDTLADTLARLLDNHRQPDSIVVAAADAAAIEPRRSGNTDTLPGKSGEVPRVERAPEMVSSPEPLAPPSAHLPVAHGVEHLLLPDTTHTLSVDPSRVDPSSGSGSGAPRGETETRLAAIWSSVLQVPSIGRDENFFDLGGHSLLAVRIGTRIERTFGKEVPLNAILEKPTIAEFAVLLEEPAPGLEPGRAKAAPEVRHRLVTLQEPGPDVTASTPFFWIPGGRAVSVLALREVSLLLGPDRPVYGVESRLPQPGESFLPVPDRARAYVALIREKQPRGPYLLAGFCVGGMVAFEVAQQFAALGETIGFLGLIQASMPGFPPTRAARRRMERQRQLYLVRTASAFLLSRINPLNGRLPRERRQAVLDRFAKLLIGWVGTSSQLPEVTQQSNGQAMMPYRPAPYAGNVHIILAEDCFESAGITESLDPRRAWTRVVQGQSQTILVPGDHVSMLSQGPARRLAEAIRSALPL